MFYDEEYVQAIINIVGCGQSMETALQFDSSNCETEGVFLNACSRAGQITPIDFATMNIGLLDFSSRSTKAHLAIADSQASSYSRERNVSTYMESMPEVLQIKYARAQSEHLNMIYHQQQAIDFLNTIMKLLLERTKKRRRGEARRKGL